MPFRFEASTFVSNEQAESAAGDFAPATRAELVSLRFAHPEIAHWGDVALAAAWGDYSEDCWMNSWETVPPASSRNENFLNYLCWRQTRGEYPRGAGDEIADEASDWRTPSKGISSQSVQPKVEAELTAPLANQKPVQLSSKAMVVEHLSVELLRSNPDCIYVFGDNLLRRGTAGQAIVRGEPNAFGIPTKRAPSMAPSAFFSDRPDEIQAVLLALRELYVLARTRTIVFPAAGLGTGLARMATYSPKAYREMCSILSNYFGFDQ